MIRLGARGDGKGLRFGISGNCKIVDLVGSFVFCGYGNGLDIMGRVAEAYVMIQESLVMNRE